MASGFRCGRWNAGRFWHASAFAWLRMNARLCQASTTRTIDVKQERALGVENDLDLPTGRVRRAVKLLAAEVASMSRAGQRRRWRPQAFAKWLPRASAKSQLEAGLGALAGVRPQSCISPGAMKASNQLEACALQDEILTIRMYVRGQAEEHILN